MSVEGCPHGPVEITGGPDTCPDCLKERGAAEEHMGAVEKKVQALQTDVQTGKDSRQPPQMIRMTDPLLRAEKVCPYCENRPSGVQCPTCELIAGEIRSAQREALEAVEAEMLLLFDEIFHKEARECQSSKLGVIERLLPRVKRLREQPPFGS